MRVLPALPKPLTIMLVFALHALVVGSLFSRIAEIQRALGLAEASFGLSMMGLPFGVFVGSPLVGPLIERLGPKRTLTFMLPVFAACPSIVAQAVGAPTLFAALALQGLALTTCNIAMNVEADRVEAEAGRRILNRCHGSWALGFLVISSLASGAIALGIQPRTHYALLLGLMIAASLLVLRRMTPSPPRQHSGSGKAPRFALPTIGTLLILGFAISGVWLEGATRSWSVIYMRDAFGAVDWLAAVALPCIVGAQMTGRFLADGWVDRFGTVRVSRALTSISLLGLALITFASSTPVALAGFALIGLGISTVHPQAVSAAARLGDRPAAVNVAALSTIQTLIVFASPPIFGFVAEHLGLRASFALILPLPLVALYFARHLEGERPPERRAAAPLAP